MTPPGQVTLKQAGLNEKYQKKHDIVNLGFATKYHSTSEE
jgi:hypothetical protein